MKENGVDTWEARMGRRAKLMAIKRRMRQNLEGETWHPDEHNLHGRVAIACGFEHGVWPPPDEWPEVIGADSPDGCN